MQLRTHGLSITQGLGASEGRSKDQEWVQIATRVSKHCLFIQITGSKFMEGDLSAVYIFIKLIKKKPSQNYPALAIFCLNTVPRFGSCYVM